MRREVQVPGVLVSERGAPPYLTDATGRFYAEMLRRNPDHYLGLLDVGDLRELYLRGCLTLGEFDRFVGEAVRRATPE